MQESIIQLTESKATLVDDTVLVILHNLPDFGLDFHTALSEWLRHEKKNRTAENLCNYLRATEPYNKCTVLTKEDYARTKIGALQ